MKQTTFFTVIFLFLFTFVACNKNEDNENQDDPNNFSTLIPETWEYEVVDSTGSILGEFNQILTDKDGGTHIVYSEKRDDDGWNIKYAYKSSSSEWQIETLPDVLAEQYSGIAISENNEISILIETYNDDGVWVMSKNIGATSWTQTVVDSHHNARYASLAYDNENVLHVAYSIANEGEYLATNQAGEFVSELVSEESTSRSDIVFDSNNTPHIFFAHSEKIFYATKTDVDWQTEIIATDADHQDYNTISAAIDSEDNVNVVYEIDNITSNVGYCFKSADGSWSVSNAGTNRAGRIDKAIAVDSEGNQHVTYYALGDTEFCVGYSSKNKGAGNWDIQLFFDHEEERFGDATSIAIDANNNPHISFKGVTNENLYYIYKK